MISLTKNEREKALDSISIPEVNHFATVLADIGQNLDPTSFADLHSIAALYEWFMVEIVQPSVNAQELSEVLQTLTGSTAEWLRESLYLMYLFQLKIAKRIEEMPLPHLPSMPVDDPEKSLWINSLLVARRQSKKSSGVLLYMNARGGGKTTKANQARNDAMLEAALSNLPDDEALDLVTWAVGTTDPGQAIMSELQSVMHTEEQANEIKRLSEAYDSIGLYKLLHKILDDEKKRRDSMLT